jgi:hypothetical protein
MPVSPTDRRSELSSAAPQGTVHTRLQEGRLRTAAGCACLLLGAEQYYRQAKRLAT